MSFYLVISMFNTISPISKLTCKDNLHIFSNTHTRTHAHTHTHTHSFSLPLPLSLSPSLSLSLSLPLEGALKQLK